MIQLSEKFFSFLFLLIPLFLITGPALPDIVITLGLIFGIMQLVIYQSLKVKF